MRETAFSLLKSHEAIRATDQNVASIRCTDRAAFPCFNVRPFLNRPPYSCYSITTRRTFISTHTASISSYVHICPGKAGQRMKSSKYCIPWRAHSTVNPRPHRGVVLINRSSSYDQSSFLIVILGFTSCAIYISVDFSEPSLNDVYSPTNLAARRSTYNNYTSVNTFKLLTLSVVLCINIDFNFYTFCQYLNLKDVWTVVLLHVLLINKTLQCNHMHVRLASLTYMELSNTS